MRLSSRREASAKRSVSASEAQLHGEVADYLTLALPAHCFWTSIDHMGGTPIIGARRKRRGVRKGIPDILLIWRGKAILIELKTQTGRLSVEQAQVHDELLLAGAVIAVCRSLDQVIGILEVVGIPLKARRAA